MQPFQNNQGINNQQPQQQSLFGNQNNQGGLFGNNNQQQQNNQNNQQQGSLFGANNNNQQGGLFQGNNQQQQQGLGLGNTNQAQNQSQANNNQQNQNQGLNNNQQNNTGLFGNNNQPQNQQQGGLFGNQQNQSQQNQASLFTNQQQQQPAIGQNNNQPQQQQSTFGNNQQQNNNQSCLFGNNNQQQQSNNIQQQGNNQQQQQQPNQQTSLFGQNNQQQNQQNPQQNNTQGLFGQNNQQNQQPPQTGLFGNNNQTLSSSTQATTQNTNQAPQQTTTSQKPQQGGLFGNQNNDQSQTQTSQQGIQSGNLTQAQQAQTTITQPSQLPANQQSQANQGTSLFSNKPEEKQENKGSLFGNNQNTEKSSLFGNNDKKEEKKETQPASSSLFGNNSNNEKKPEGGLFQQTETKPVQTGSGLFGNKTEEQKPNQDKGSLFGNNQQTKVENQEKKPESSGGLFGNQPQSSTVTGSLFGGDKKDQAAQPTVKSDNQSGLFAQDNKTLEKKDETKSVENKQPLASGSLFGGNQSKPSETPKQPTQEKPVPQTQTTEQKVESKIPQPPSNYTQKEVPKDIEYLIKNLQKDNEKLLYFLYNINDYIEQEIIHILNDQIISLKLFSSLEYYKINDQQKTKLWTQITENEENFKKHCTSNLKYFPNFDMIMWMISSLYYTLNISYYDCFLLLDLYLDKHSSEIDKFILFNNGIRELNWDYIKSQQIMNFNDQQKAISYNENSDFIVSLKKNIMLKVFFNQRTLLLKCQQLCVDNIKISPQGNKLYLYKVFTQHLKKKAFFQVLLKNYLSISKEDIHLKTQISLQEYCVQQQLELLSLQKLIFDLMHHAQSLLKDSSKVYCQQTILEMIQVLVEQDGKGCYNKCKSSFQYFDDEHIQEFEQISNASFTYSLIFCISMLFTQKHTYIEKMDENSLTKQPLNIIFESQNLNNYLYDQFQSDNHKDMIYPLVKLYVNFLTWVKENLPQNFNHQLLNDNLQKWQNQVSKINVIPLMKHQFKQFIAFNSKTSYQVKVFKSWVTYEAWYQHHINQDLEVNTINHLSDLACLTLKNDISSIKKFWDHEMKSNVKGCNGLNILLQFTKNNQVKNFNKFLRILLGNSEYNFKDQVSTILWTSYENQNPFLLMKDQWEQSLNSGQVPSQYVKLFCQFLINSPESLEELERAVSGNITIPNQNPDNQIINQEIYHQYNLLKLMIKTLNQRVSGSSSYQNYILKCLIKLIQSNKTKLIVYNELNEAANSSQNFICQMIQQLSESKQFDKNYIKVLTHIVKFVYYYIISTEYSLDPQNKKFQNQFLPQILQSVFQNILTDIYMRNNFYNFVQAEKFVLGKQLLKLVTAMLSKFVINREQKHIYLELNNNTAEQLINQNGLIQLFTQVLNQYSYPVQGLIESALEITINFEQLKKGGQQSVSQVQNSIYYKYCYIQQQQSKKINFNIESIKQRVQGFLYNSLTCLEKLILINQFQRKFQYEQGLHLLENFQKLLDENLQGGFSVNIDMAYDNMMNNKVVSASLPFLLFPLLNIHSNKQEKTAYVNKMSIYNICNKPASWDQVDTKSLQAQVLRILCLLSDSANSNKLINSMKLVILQQNNYNSYQSTLENQQIINQVFQNIFTLLNQGTQTGIINKINCTQALEFILACLENNQTFLDQVFKYEYQNSSQKLSIQFLNIINRLVYSQQDFKIINRIIALFNFIFKRQKQFGYLTQCIKSSNNPFRDIILNLSNCILKEFKRISFENKYDNHIFQNNLNYGIVLAINSLQNLFDLLHNEFLLQNDHKEIINGSISVFLKDLYNDPKFKEILQLRVLEDIQLDFDFGKFIELETQNQFIKSQDIQVWGQQGSQKYIVTKRSSNLKGLQDILKDYQSYDFGSNYIIDLEYLSLMLYQSEYNYETIQSILINTHSYNFKKILNTSKIQLYFSLSKLFRSVTSISSDSVVLSGAYFLSSQRVLPDDFKYVYCNFNNKLETNFVQLSNYSQSEGAQQFSKSLDLLKWVFQKLVQGVCEEMQSLDDQNQILGTDNQLIQNKFILIGECLQHIQQFRSKIEYDVPIQSLRMLQLMILHYLRQNLDQINNRNSNFQYKQVIYTLLKLFTYCDTFVQQPIFTDIQGLLQIIDILIKKEPMSELIYILPIINKYYPQQYQDHINSSNILQNIIQVMFYQNIDITLFQACIKTIQDYIWTSEKETNYLSNIGLMSKINHAGIFQDSSTMQFYIQDQLGKIIRNPLQIKWNWTLILIRDLVYNSDHDVKQQLIIFLEQNYNRVQSMLQLNNQNLSLACLDELYSLMQLLVAAFQFSFQPICEKIFYILKYQTLRQFQTTKNLGQKIEAQSDVEKQISNFQFSQQEQQPHQSKVLNQTEISFLVSDFDNEQDTYVANHLQNKYNDNINSYHLNILQFIGEQKSFQLLQEICAALYQGYLNSNFLNLFSNRSFNNQQVVTYDLDYWLNQSKKYHNILVLIKDSISRFIHPNHSQKVVQLIQKSKLIIQSTEYQQELGGLNPSSMAESKKQLNQNMNLLSKEVIESLVIFLNKWESYINQINSYNESKEANKYKLKFQEVISELQDTQKQLTFEERSRTKSNINISDQNSTFRHDGNEVNLADILNYLDEIKQYLIKKNY